MSEETKQEGAPPPKKPSPKEAAPKPPPKAPEAPKPPPAEATAAPRMEEMTVKAKTHGAGNFVAMMALAVALGSLALTGFFAYAKARPSGIATQVATMRETTTRELKALTARVAGLEATMNELQVLRRRTSAVNTLDLKKALVSLREVGKNTSGRTSKKVQQVEGALKALINDLEAQGR